MLLDLSLPDGNGLDFFEANQERLEETVVLVMTAVGQVDDAVRAMKLGALDFLTKPVDHEALVQLVDRSLDYRSDQLEAQAARSSRERELQMDIVAHSDTFRKTLDVACDVARSDVTSVLIQGESGTGKNVVARYIHAMSPREEKPFLEVNCAAIPEQLMESELFGHERGAFTDAKTSKRGTVELADGGTVVLDEIAELKPDLQSKLLSFLENRHFRRVGGVREIGVDIRIIALTNRDLPGMVSDGRFRNDLFYRLSVFPITVPPLRERIDDILPLSKHFMVSLKGKYGRPFSGYSRDAENQLLGYSWPGNVRELRNAVERAMILERGSTITSASLILEGVGVLPSTASEESSGLPDGIVPLEEVELEMVKRALSAASNNQTRAAELLGITRDQLRYRLKKFDL
jgi:DNA-binding NtrC family response regulator